MQDKIYDIVTLGLMAYDMILRTVDESIFTRDATLLQNLGVSSGGGAMTQAVVANRLGCKTLLMGKVGGDSFGEYLLEQIKKEKLDCSFVQKDEKGETMVTIALVKGDGTRNFLTREGNNNSSFCLEDINLEVLGQAKIVSYGSFYFLPGLDGLGEDIIFKEAKSKGAITVADTASDAFGKGRNLVYRNLEWIDYFIPSYEEALYLTGRKDYEEMAQELLAKGGQNIIIKLGEKGCYAADRAGGSLIPAFPAASICDTTGAGDNFVGAFMTGLIDGLNMRDAAEFANAAAAISTAGLGAVSSLKNKRQVHKFMEERKRL